MIKKVLRVLVLIAVIVAGFWYFQIRQSGSDIQGIPEHPFPCVLTNKQLEAVTPVMDSLADSLEDIAPKYISLSDYRKRDALHQSSRGPRLDYDHNFNPPKSKRGILPTDFGKNGIHISFFFGPIPPPGVLPYAMASPTAVLRNTGLYVWCEFYTAPDTPEQTRRQIDLILQSHVDRLIQIDKNNI